MPLLVLGDMAVELSCGELQIVYSTIIFYCAQNNSFKTYLDGLVVIFQLFVRITMVNVAILTLFRYA